MNVDLMLLFSEFLGRKKKKKEIFSGDGIRGNK
jgi:hypothetical protein